MTGRPAGTDHDRHKALGVELSSTTWELLGGDPDALIHTAHASAYHWMQVGTAANRARSEWLCARAYSELGRPEPALHHAQIEDARGSRPHRGRFGRYPGAVRER